MNTEASWGWTTGLIYGSNSYFFQLNNDTNFDLSHTDGHYGETIGNMYQYSWSLAINGTTLTTSSYGTKTSTHLSGTKTKTSTATTATSTGIFLRHAVCWQDDGGSAWWWNR